jgi:hypothetical protein
MGTLGPNIKQPEVELAVCHEVVLKVTKMQHLGRMTLHRDLPLGTACSEFPTADCAGLLAPAIPRKSFLR